MVGSHLLHGREQFGVALLPDQAADGADEHGVTVGVQVLADGGDGLRVNGLRIEPGQVDAVAQQGQPAAGHPEPGQGREVLVVLDQLGVRAGGGQALEAVDGGPLGGPVVLGGVEAVLGVDDHRHPGRLGGQAAVDAGLGVVGVDDGGPELPEQRVELGQGPGVAGEGPAPGGVAQRDMADAVGLEPLDEGAGGRRPDHLVARVLEGPELGAEEELQADVGGGDVQQPGSAHVVAPA